MAELKTKKNGARVKDADTKVLKELQRKLSGR